MGVLSVALISSAVSMKIGGLIDPVILSNAANMIQNLSQHVSACKMAGR